MTPGFYSAYSTIHAMLTILDLAQGGIITCRTFDAYMTYGNGIKGDQGDERGDWIQGNTRAIVHKMLWRRVQAMMDKLAAAAASVVPINCTYLLLAEQADDCVRPKKETEETAHPLSWRESFLLTHEVWVNIDVRSQAALEL